jgi:hypothetical protein
LRHRSAASSARSTLLGEAGRHRADSQKPELLTMTRQYDDSLDSARFNQPRRAAEWCAWLARCWRSSERKFTIRQRSAPQTSMERRVVGADWRLTAGKVLLDQSMLAGEPVSHRSRATPVSLVPLICRRLGSGRSLRHESAFVPQIALLIAAATANRRVLASGHDLQVIPVTLGVSSWKVSRRRLRPASCSSLSISRI